MNMKKVLSLCYCCCDWSGDVYPVVVWTCERALRDVAVVFGVAYLVEVCEKRS